MKPNVLFLVIDSLRKDRLYPNVNKSSVTPNFDKIIKEGTRFEQCISCSDGTIFSMGSVFSSMFPFKLKSNDDSLVKLHSKVSTHIEQLKKLDYNTYSVTYDIKSIHGFTKDFEFNFPYDIGGRLYDGLDSKILDHFKNLNEPWFFYIHLEDLHTPFTAPKSFDSPKFGKDQYDRVVSGIDLWFGQILTKIDLSKTLIIITADHGEYIPTIIRGDKIFENKKNLSSKIQTLLGRALPSNLDPIKLKIIKTRDEITSQKQLDKLKDHELSVVEKRNLTNKRANPTSENYLFDDLLRIPLIFSGKSIPQNCIISEQVGLIDIFPTLFDFLHIEINSGEFDGKSFLKSFSGETIKEKPIYIESTMGLDNQPRLIGIRTSKFKYFRYFENKNLGRQLFDLKTDPLEEKNIANSELEIVSQMEKLLENMLENFVKLPDEVIDENEKSHIEEELKKLGYI